MYKKVRYRCEKQTNKLKLVNFKFYLGKVNTISNYFALDFFQIIIINFFPVVYDIISVFFLVLCSSQFKQIVINIGS